MGRGALPSVANGKGITMSPRASKSFIVQLVLSAWILGVSAIGPTVHAAQGEPTMHEGSAPFDLQQSWKAVDNAITEQRFEAASTVVREILGHAREAKLDDEITRALIKETQLRHGLHGPEKATLFLRDEAWPENGRSRLILGLFYGSSLARYLSDYSYEIAGREKVATTDTTDLKLWTQGQITDEIRRVYGEVWRQREGWGGASIGEFAEHIEQNGYPARIRGTLRDAVTYLWVDHLQDHLFWTPRQEAVLPPLRTLLDEPAGEGETVDDTAHPLERVRFLLEDLAAWHDGRREPEAALEARLTWRRVAAASYRHSDDRDALLESLQSLLDAFDHRLPWWSKGQALLAEQLRSQDRPDALVRARDAARRGAEAHPRSRGGQECRALVEQLEAVSFSLASMALDGPGRRSLELTHTNLDHVFFRAFALGPLHVEGRPGHGSRPTYREVEALIAGHPPVAEWAVKLEPMDDLRAHRTFVTPPLEANGLYVVLASKRADFERRENQMTAILLQLTDLVLRVEAPERAKGSEWTARLRSGDRGEPVPGARIQLYRQERDGRRLVSEQTTDRDGTAIIQRSVLDSPDSDRGRWTAHTLVASTGDGETLDRVEAPAPIYPYTPLTVDEGPTFLAFTDRSAYRPGQTVHWKIAVYRRGAPASRPGSSPFSAVAGQKAAVRLLDANGEQITVANVETNAWGSASGSFVLPPGRALGRWFLQADEQHFLTDFSVEEYKRPTFRVELETPEKAPRLGEETVLSGEARYYFGLPVTGGEARWRVTRFPVRPRFFCWPPLPMPEPLILAAGTSPLGTDGRFTVRFTPQADDRVDPSQRTLMRYRFQVEAEITEPGGETRQSEKAYVAGWVAVEADIESELAFFTADEPVHLTVRRHFDGQAKPGVGTWSLVRLRQPDSVPAPADLPPDQVMEGNTTEGDRRRARWDTFTTARHLLAMWPDGDEVASGELDHGDDGRASLDAAVEPGAYRLIYRTVDAFGETLERRHELLVVADDGPAIALPGMLLAQKDTVKVGETVRFLVLSGFDDQAMDFRLAHGDAVEHRLLRSNGRPQLIEFEAGPSDRGGFQARLSLIHDYQRVSDQAEVSVPWSDRELHVELASFRDTLRPGGRETWRVKLKPEPGTDAEDPASVELLAYMFDKSLELFGSHNYPHPDGLFPRAPDLNQAQDGLGSGPVVWQHRDNPRRAHLPGLTPDRLLFFDNIPIGGPGGRGGMRFREMPMMAMKAAPVPEADMQTVAIERSAVLTGEIYAARGQTMSAALAFDAAEPSPPPPAEPGAPTGDGPELRTDFSETAFWYPHLLLDEDGGVSFEFTVPDSVTEWDVWIHALSRKLGHGTLRRQVRTVKDLLVRPSLPRFFRQGDTAELRVVIGNSGSEPLAGDLDFAVLDAISEADVSASFGLRAVGDTRFEVAAGESITRRFQIVVPDRVGAVAVRAVASAGDRSDGELRPLPVLPSRLFLSQSRFAALQGPGETELVFDDLLQADDDPSLRHESLVVTLDAQLFYAVLGSLPYLVEYPYECVEQTLNRFVSTGMLASLFERYPSVAKMAAGLAKDRDTPVAPWQEEDPNRRMLLEETPWLRTARGGDTPDGTELLKILDPQVAEAQRRKSLGELTELQGPDGGFPWWSGGPSSPYITMYVLQGLARAMEYDVRIPEELVQGAWRYLADWSESRPTSID